MSDISSPNHGLDSPTSDDYSTTSTSVLDSNSILADGLTSNFKSTKTISTRFFHSFFELDSSTHTADSRSTTISESASTSDHHQHISPPLTREHNPFSQSTVDSLHSCKTLHQSLFFFRNLTLEISVPQDSTTIDSTDTAIYTQEQIYESYRLAPETAYTAWFRMLGSLGNINQIRSPEQHNRIMKTLFEIWKMLCRVISLIDCVHFLIFFWFS